MIVLDRNRRRRLSPWLFERTMLALMVGGLLACILVVGWVMPS